MLLFLTQLSLICALVLSAAGNLSRWHKYAELASHFKFQYLVASVVCLLSFSIFREWIWAALAVFGVSINLTAIVPWYVGRTKAGKRQISGRRVKLLLANVNHLNTEYGSFIASVKKHMPDMLIVQEAHSAWCDSLQRLQDLYPFYLELPKGGGSGMALYSRFQFERLALALPEGEVRPGILAKVDIEGISVSLLTIHPRAPIQRGHFELRNVMLVSAAYCLQNLPGPKIFIGDLNITLWSHYYRAFVKQADLTNVRKGFGLLPTWPAYLLFKWLMIPLDHCLVSDGIAVVSVKTGDATGSDHLPLLVELEIQ